MLLNHISPFRSPFPFSALPVGEPKKKIEVDDPPFLPIGFNTL